MAFHEKTAIPTLTSVINRVSCGQK